jgi:hypothetical protein
MRNPSHHIAQHTARTLTLACFASLLAIASYLWMPQIRRVLAEGLMPSGRVAVVKADHASLKLHPTDACSSASTHFLNVLGLRALSREYRPLGFDTGF